MSNDSLWGSLEISNVKQLKILPCTRLHSRSFWSKGATFLSLGTVCIAYLNKRGKHIKGSAVTVELDVIKMPEGVIQEGHLSFSQRFRLELQNDRTSFHL